MILIRADIGCHAISKYHERRKCKQKKNSVLTIYQFKRRPQLRLPRIARPHSLLCLYECRMQVIAGAQTVVEGRHELGGSIIIHLREAGDDSPCTCQLECLHQPQRPLNIIEDAVVRIASREHHQRRTLEPHLGNLFRKQDPIIAHALAALSTEAPIAPRQYKTRVGEFGLERREGPGEIKEFMLFPGDAIRVADGMGGEMQDGRRGRTSPPDRLLCDCIACECCHFEASRQAAGCMLDFLLGRSEAAPIAIASRMARQCPIVVDVAYEQSL